MVYFPTVFGKIICKIILEFVSFGSKNRVTKIKPSVYMDFFSFQEIYVD